MQATDCCYTTIPHTLSQVSQKPIHFFRALRSSVDAVGCWVAIPDTATRELQASNVFSAVHGLLGARKLATVSFENSKCLAMDVWSVVKRVKKFVAALAWFCKVAKEAGYVGARYASWTSSMKVIQLPMDCISVVFSVVKICKIAIAWLRLQSETKSPELQNQMVRLEDKVIKELLYGAVKVLDVAECAFEYFIPSAHLVLSLNSLAIAAIRITTLYYVLASPSSTCKTALNSSMSKM